MSISSESHDQFLKAHGKYVARPDTNTFVFEDGATMDYVSSELWMSREPPTDDLERLTLIEEYYHTVVQNAANDFEKYKNDLHQSSLAAQQFGNAAMLPDKASSIAELKRLRGIVRREFAKFKEAEAEKQKHVPHHIAVREQVTAQGRGAAADFWSAVSKVEL